jgi:hypothetical protein
MSYLGQAALKNSELKRFDVTSSTSATHVLSWTAPNEQSLWITINGVKQQDDAYSIAGIPTTITLTNALVATDKMEVIGVLDIGVITTPGDNTVSTATLGDNAVTSAKIADGTIATADIADDAVTADKLANAINTSIAANTAKVTNATHTGDVTGATALTIAADAVDIAMLSATGTASATTFLRGDNSWAAATTAARYVYAWLSGTHQAITAATNTLAALNSVTQSHSAYDASTYTWTATADDVGIWVFNCQACFYFDSNNGDDPRTYIWYNGAKTAGSYSWTWYGTDSLRHITVTQQFLVSISTSDTIQMYVHQNAASGAAYLFSGDGGAGQYQCSLLGYKL